jgi:hypothetical protein
MPHVPDFEAVVTAPAYPRPLDQSPDPHRWAVVLFGQRDPDSEGDDEERRVRILRLERKHQRQIDARNRHVDGPYWRAILGGGESALVKFKVGNGDKR